MGSFTMHYHTPHHHYDPDAIAKLIGRGTDVVTGERNHSAVITDAAVTPHGFTITLDMTCTCDACTAQPNTFPLGHIDLPADTLKESGRPGHDGQRDTSINDDPQVP